MDVSYGCDEMAANVRKDISDLIVNTDTMANLLGYTRQRINQLAKEGILEKKAPGRFYLMLNVQRYIDFLKAGQHEEEEESQAAYWEEKALHEKAKREMAELKLAKLKNRLHDADDVEMVMTNMLATFRSRILGIPQKIAPQILGMENLAEINEMINQELELALAELSEYNPEMFAGGEEIEEEDDQVIPENTEDGCTPTEADN